MSEESNKDTNVKSTIEAVAALAKAIPVYEDAIQPAAKQIGTSLEIITKVVNIALLPLKGVIWGYEKIEEWFNTSVANKLKDVPEENIITPPLMIAGPTIDAVKYVGEVEELRDLYANLLATSMNKNTVHNAHPGYVDIIKNITKDEALMLKCFINRDIIPTINVQLTPTNGTSHRDISRHYSIFSTFDALERSDLAPSYLDNLCRLGILEIPDGLSMANTNVYKGLEDAFEDFKVSLSGKQEEVKFEHRFIRVTAFGKQFIQNIVK